MHIWPGLPYPLGATFDGGGTTFAIFSEVAETIELCLFDELGGESRVALPERNGLVWHGYLPRVGPGQLRLPGTRTLRPTRRPALQPVQAAARPVRQGYRRARRVERRRRAGDRPCRRRHRPQPCALSGYGYSSPKTVR